ncbi:MAG: DUF2304 domain-containing protein, partial [Phycisphaerae bacterium]|nr:DUF2304 domain-containing protein [Phycisphaerae bacterium]
MPAATTFHCPENFTIIQRIIPLLVAAVIVAATVELIRRRKLREEFAVLWVLASVTLLVFAALPRLLWIISEQLDIFYLTTMFLAGFGFLSLVSIHLAMIASRLSDSNRKTAHRVALL